MQDEPDIPVVTLGGLARRAAQLWPDSVFIHDGDTRLTFAAVDRHADQFASGLVSAGLKRGEHLGIWLPNGWRFAVAFLAAARIGLTVVPINTRYKASEARSVIEGLKVDALIMHDRLWSVDFLALLRDIAPAALDPGAAGAPRDVILVADRRVAGTTPFEAVAATPVDPAAVATAEQAVAVSDLLLIASTSGSTGKPKGVMHCHRVIRQSARVGARIGMAAGTATLGHLPFYHSGGLFMQLIAALALGSTLVLMRDWKAEAALDLIERHRIRTFGGATAHYLDLMTEQARAPRDLSSLEGTWFGGVAIGQQAYDRYVDGLGLKRLMSGYGMTENTIATSFNRWDDPRERCCNNSAPILANCEVRIVDPDRLDAQPHGVDGEIWCRGETVMLGYYDNPEATAKAITKEGWLRTGDVGHLDAQGYLTITGRIKEMLKVGGTNAYCSHIENLILRHPDVLVCAVVGVPDARLSEVPFAFVELRDGAQADAAGIIDFSRRIMADYQVPRHVRFLDAIPRTGTGKFDRPALERMARAAVAKA